MGFRILLALVAVALAAQTEFQDEAEYREEMREIDHAFTSLSEHRGVRTGPELEREAARLAALFTDVEEFWKARGNEEAASFAAMAKDGAEEAGTAARDGDDDSFDAAVEIIAASCEGCHKDPLDKYRFRSPE
jgi:hypothetical protein